MESGRASEKWKKRGAKRKFPPLRGGRSDAESIRVIVPRGEGGRRGLNRLAEGGRKGERGLTEARARIRAITTPVPQLRLREKSEPERL